ncbi:MAG: hypothetical protein HDS26_00020 [Bacteroides sp.]|nr:hypothetical protein [Bacteroides sp.]
MKILTVTIILEENEGENYDVETFNNIITEAITGNTSVNILDGNISMFEIQKQNGTKS